MTDVDLYIENVIGKGDAKEEIIEALVQYDLIE